MLKNLFLLGLASLTIASCGEPKPYEMRVTGRQQFTLFFDERPADMLITAKQVEREYCHQEHCTIRFVYNNTVLAHYNKSTGNLIDFNR